MKSAGSPPNQAQSPLLEWPQTILHVDMDAFYVNVYLLEHPDDSGVPLAVGGKPDQRGVVTSASYEARQFGVRSAMPTSRAVRICPGLKIVPANWTRINECSRQVMGILAEYGPVEQMSVDEAYIDLAQWSEPELVAAEVQLKVKERSLLPCSVGLATSKLVAKVASDYDKPEGCTIVSPGEEADFLAPLPTRAVWGIGPRTAERLAEMGIETCGQLAAADLAELEGHFGRQAESLRNRAQGIDDRSVRSERGRARSISQEWTFSRDVNDAEILDQQIKKMSDRVAQSLKKRNLVAHTVRVKFRWKDFTTFTRQKTLEVGTDGAETIYQMASAIFHENWSAGQWVRLIGVGVSKLNEPAGRQLDFGF